MVKYYKLIVYLIVVLLVNMAGITMFTRVDLTSDGLYSLSKVSRDAVSMLSEPLTIKVFFTKNLPAPHNNTERYLHDLLEEYAVSSNDYFNYSFYDVSAEEGDLDEDALKNQQVAQSYGIYPVQIQNIEQDEVKFKRAYMGMVLIHGDVIDKIPSITSTEGLEYTVTSKIEKMNNKISALLNLKEPVKIDLYYSSSMDRVAPHLRMSGLSEIPSKVASVVEELNGKYYGKLRFSSYDPTNDPSLEEHLLENNLMMLTWPDIDNRAGELMVEAGRGTIGLVITSGGKSKPIPLISVFKLPLFGTQYQLVDMNSLPEIIGEAVDDVIDINKKIGYLADHGTLKIFGGVQPQAQGQSQMDVLSNFNSLVSRDYSLEQVQLGEGAIPDGIDCLIIAGPKERFSDYELFQLDQFLMKGKSIAIFLDSFQEIAPPPNQARMNYNQGPVYRPVMTGLDKLLSYYGAQVKQSYVLDENCFEQRMPQMYGGGKRSIYFVPLIKNEYINTNVTFMNNIKGLVTVKSSPVMTDEETIKSNNLDADVLFSSSELSWEMSGRIDLNPLTLSPPTDMGDRSSMPLAAIIRGGFPSYFAGKPIPEKPAAGDEGQSDIPDSTASLAASPTVSMADSLAIKGEGSVVTRGKPGKLFIVGTSEILKDNVLDENGATPNSTFIMNSLDNLNGRDDYASMRSKSQRFNPLKEVSPVAKAFVKTFNIAGLPVVVVLFGIAVWFRRTARKKAVQVMFDR